MSNALSTLHAGIAVLILHFLLLTTVPASGQVQEPPEEEAEKDTLTLNAAIQSALAYYPQLAIQQHEIEKAGLKRNQALQTFLPKVSLEGRYTFLNEPIAIGLPELNIQVSPDLVLSPDLPDIEIQSDRFFQASLQIEQVLFTGGEVLHSVRAAGHGHSAKMHEAEAAKAALIKDVIEAWDRIAMLRQSLRVLDEALERIIFEQTRANQAWEEGLIPYYDITRIRLFRQQLMDQQAELRGGLELTYEQLSLLTGLSAGRFRTNQSVSETAELPNATPNTWHQRPEWQAANENVRANEHLVKAGKGDFMPSVFAFFKRELYEDDLTLLDPLWAAGAGFRWTIFNRGQTTRELQLARKDLNIAREQRALAADGFELQQKQADIEQEVAASRLQTAALMVDEAETTLDLATRRYELGLGDVGERLQAEADYQQALLAQEKARFALRRAQVEALATSGSLRPSMFKNE